MRIDGKLTNSDGEFIASGPCEVNRDRGEVTMWPSWTLHMLERERGQLTLDLADGQRMTISDRHLTFKLRAQDNERITVYRLRVIERVPEHLASGYSEPDVAGAPRLLNDVAAARDTAGATTADADTLEGSHAER